MAHDATELARQAFEAYARGDTATLLEFVDPDLEWTFLDPSEEDPEPRVCHGSTELALRVARQHEAGLHPELEEVSAFGERVLVVTHVPGLAALRARAGDDRNYHLVTFRDGRIVALRACRDREEAVDLAAMA